MGDEFCTLLLVYDVTFFLFLETAFETVYNKALKMFTIISAVGAQDLRYHYAYMTYSYGVE
jgi:hypothetical protein